VEALHALEARPHDLDKAQQSRVGIARGVPAPVWLY